MSPTIFESLKEQRQAKKISLEEIAERTRINIKFIQAIEDGRLDVLPPVYVRIFFRNYVRQLGLDAGQALEQFDRYCGKTAAPEPAVDEPAPPVPGNGGPSQAADAGGEEDWHLDPLKRVFPFAIGVVLIFFIGYFLVGRTVREEIPEPVPEPAAEKVMPTVPSVPPVASVPGTPEKSVSAVSGSLTVRVVALKYCWILLARDDADTVYSGFLQKHDDLSIPAEDHVFLKIGLSETGDDAVEVFLNNRSLGSWGAAGTRLTKFRIVRTGIDESSVRIRKIPSPTPDSAGTAGPGSSGTLP